MISAIPGATNCVIGRCSLGEIETAKRVLSPPEEKIVKGHLLDICAGSGGDMSMSIRGLAGRGVFSMPLPSGSVIINCTDNLGEHTNIHQPVVSDDGLVLAPQAALGFTGQSAHFLTHAWYLSCIDPLWRNLPRPSFSHRDKINSTIRMMFAVVISTTMATRVIASSGAQGRRVIESSKQVRQPF